MDTVHKPRLLGAVIVAGMLLLQAMTAHGVAVEKQFTVENCEFPLSLFNPGSAQVIAEMPERLPVMEDAPLPVFAMTVTSNTALRGWLRTFGARTLEGEMTMVGRLSPVPASAQAPVTVPIAPMAIPTSGHLTFTAEGTGMEDVIHRALTQAANYEVARFELALTARNSQGNILSGSLGEFTGTCYLEWETDRILHTFKADPYVFVGLQPHFGQLQVGTTRSQTVQVKNNATTAVALDQVTLSGPDADSFSVTTECTSIAPDERCEFTVTAMPFGELGSREAQLNIVMGDAQGTTLTMPLTVSVVAREYARLRLSTDAVEFGDVPLGLTVMKTLRVMNAANHLSVGPGQFDLALSGPDSEAFVLDSNCPEIDGEQGGVGCIIHVLHEATETGPRDALLAINTEHPEAANFQVPLSVNGISEGQYTYRWTARPYHLAAEISPGSNDFAGELGINTHSRNVPTSGSYSLWPDLEFVPLEPLTGRLVDGVLTAQVQMQVNIPSGKHRRMAWPLGPNVVIGEFGGEDCRGVTPVTVTLQSSPNAPAFSLLWGGTLRASYTLPRFTGCGDYTLRLNWYAAGTEVQQGVPMRPAD